jgi:hypothetical protein
MPALHCQIGTLAKIKIPFVLFAVFRGDFILVAERRWKSTGCEVAGFMDKKSMS